MPRQTSFAGQDVTNAVKLGRIPALAAMNGRCRPALARSISRSPSFGARTIIAFSMSARSGQTLRKHRHVPMQFEQLFDRLGRTAAETAFRRYPKSRQELARRSEASFRTGQAVREMSLCSLVRRDRGDSEIRHHGEVAIRLSDPVAICSDRQSSGGTDDADFGGIWIYPCKQKPDFNTASGGAVTVRLVRSENRTARVA